MTADAPEIRELSEFNSTRLNGNAREMCLMLEPTDQDQLCMPEQSELGRLKFGAP
jgi:hypothetical protein